MTVCIGHTQNPLHSWHLVPSVLLSSTPWRGCGLSMLNMTNFYQDHQPPCHSPTGLHSWPPHPTAPTTFCSATPSPRRHDTHTFTHAICEGLPSRAAADALRTEHPALPAQLSNTSQIHRIGEPEAGTCISMGPIAWGSPQAPMQSKARWPP